MTKVVTKNHVGESLEVTFPDGDKVTGKIIKISFEENKVVYHLEGIYEGKPTSFELLDDILTIEE